MPPFQTLTPAQRDPYAFANIAGLASLVQGIQAAKQKQAQDAYNSNLMAALAQANQITNPDPYAQQAARQQALLSAINRPAAQPQSGIGGLVDTFNPFTPSTQDQSQHNPLAGAIKTSILQDQLKDPIEEAYKREKINELKARQNNLNRAKIIQKPQVYQDENQAWRVGIFDQEGNLLKDIREATDKEINGETPSVTFKNIESGKAAGRNATTNEMNAKTKATAVENTDKYNTGRLAQGQQRIDLQKQALQIKENDSKATQQLKARAQDSLDVLRNAQAQLALSKSAGELDPAHINSAILATQALKQKYMALKTQYAGKDDEESKAAIAQYDSEILSADNTIASYKEMLKNRKKPQQQTKQSTPTQGVTKSGLKYQIVR